MAGRTVRADHEERSLAAVRLNAAREDGGVFGAAEVHRVLADGHAFNGFARLREDVDELFVVSEVDGFAHLLNLVFAALADRAALDDGDGRVVHVLIDVARFAADFHLHEGMRRNHVAAFAGDELTHVDAGHAGAVAGNAEELHERVAGGGHGVAAGIGFDARVGRTARVGDVELRRAEEAVGLDGEFARLAHHGDVSAEEVVRIVDDAGGGHAGSAAHAFFSRLEENLELALHLVLVVGKPVRDGKARGGMGVVAAGMHEARTGRAEAFLRGNMVGIRRFGHRHAVDVEADRERGTGAARIHHADAAREAVHFLQKLFGNAVLAGVGEARFDHLLAAAEAVVGVDYLLAHQNFIAELAQLLDDVCRRREFAPAFLRHGVKVTTGADEFVVILAKAGHPFCSF